MSLTSRRTFLQSAGFAAVGVALPVSRLDSLRSPHQSAPADPWTTADAILKRIVAPRFPDRGL
jgi:hypothetical protein